MTREEAIAVVEQCGWRLVTRDDPPDTWTRYHNPGSWREPEFRDALMTELDPPVGRPLGQRAPDAILSTICVLITREKRVIRKSSHAKPLPLP